VNDRTLLPVLVPASPGSTFIARFRSAPIEVLGRLGIDPLVIEKELEAMDEVQLSSTRSRVVLGSMNDFAFLLVARREWEGEASCR